MSSDLRYQQRRYDDKIDNTQDGRVNIVTGHRVREMVAGGTMRRMRWILIAALIFGAAPVLAADKTVGVIMSGNIGYYQDVHKAFVGALLKEGFDHRKVDTLLQMPSPDPMSWTNAARKLAVADVNVLVTYGAPAALAAIRETKSIPIVFAGVYDPERRRRLGQEHDRHQLQGADDEPVEVLEEDHRPLPSSPSSTMSRSPTPCGRRTNWRSSRASTVSRRSRCRSREPKMPGSWCLRARRTPCSSQ